MFFNRLKRTLGKDFRIGLVQTFELVLVLDYIFGLTAFFWILVDVVDLLNLPTVTVKTVKVDPK